MELGERKKRILKAVIDNYIETADPVGSKSIAEKEALDLSPATIRNEMAELEAMGYLEQPHTSAGRIPSPAGYRLYVNELMNRYSLTSREMDEINRAINLKLSELDNIISEAGRLLSQITSYAAYSVSPGLSNHQWSIRKVELVFVDEYCVVALLMTDTGIVRNKLIRIPIPVSREDAANLSAVMNRALTGLKPDDITPELAQYLVSLCSNGEPIISPFLNFVTEAFRELSSRDVYVAGTSQLLDQPEYRDVYRARGLLEYLSDKKGVTELPEPAPEKPMQIIIGPENVADQLKDASVVMARYEMGNNMHGLIGIVGPTRMNYSRLASRLSYFARRLESLFLNEEHPPGIEGG